MKTTFEKALCFAVPLFALMADQATKTAVRIHFRAGGGEITVVPGFIELVNSYNAGGAFGLLRGAPALFLAVAVVFVAAAFVLLAAARLSPAARWGLGLTAGGALGNLVDRFRWGRVYDFIDCRAGAYHWPAFNAADAFIVIGAALIALSLLRGDAEGEPSTENA
ncbi:MAG: signal peptidase II [bacterium]